MFKKQNRLPAGQKLRNANSFSTEYFRVFIQPNESAYVRFGFVVGKKVDKRAVVRNHIKRVLREAVKEYALSDHGHDVLFVVRRSFTDEQTQEVVKMAQEILQKAFV